jgi:hypothetical protein
MNGMMNEAPQQGAGSAPPVSDPILKQIEDGVEAKVPEPLKQMYQSVVTAGMAVMFSKQTHDLMQKRLTAKPDLVEAVSSAVADLVAGVYNQVAPKLGTPEKQKFPAAAAMASTVLMCQMLDYAEKTMGAKVTPEMAGNCAQVTSRAVLAKFGIGQQQIVGAVQAGQRAQQGGAPAPSPAAPPAAGGMMGG